MEKNLLVPYKSQWDSDADKTGNDCGPASIAMILNYFGENLTTNQVFDKTGADQGLISVSQMQKAISAFGYSSMRKLSQTPVLLKSYIDQNLPVIALVHYGSLNSVQDKAFKGGHFFVVVGYRDDGYFVNDPNFKGSLRFQGDHHFFTKAEFEKAWQDCTLDGNQPNSLIVINRKNNPPSQGGQNQGEQDMSKLLDFLGMDEQGAIDRLTTQLGSDGKKCQWGDENASIDNKGGDLGAARRDIKKLQSSLATEKQASYNLGYKDGFESGKLQAPVVNDKLEEVLKGAKKNGIQTKEFVEGVEVITNYEI